MIARIRALRSFSPAHFGPCDQSFRLWSAGCGLKRNKTTQFASDFIVLYDLVFSCFVMQSENGPDDVLFIFFNRSVVFCICAESEF